MSPRLPHSSHALPAATIAAATALLAGCVSENDRLTLGHEVELEVFSPDRPGIMEGQTPLTTPASAQYAAFEHGPRAPIGIDRSGWSPTPFVVPVDGTGHRPTYAVSLQMKNSTARQRGEFPTALSALELTGGYTDEQLVESLDSPVVVFGSALAIPVRMLIDPQWRTHYSPRWSYDRWPGGSEPAGATHETAEEEAAALNGATPMTANDPVSNPAANPTGNPADQEWPR